MSQEHRLCESCSWFENPNRLVDTRDYTHRQPRPKAGVLIQTPSKKVLVVQTYHRHFGIPKGHQEEKECLIETARRELLEETGVTVPLLADQYRRIREVTYFLAEGEETDLSRHAFTEHDVTGVGWVHLECLHRLPSPFNQSSLKLLQKVGVDTRALVAQKKLLSRSLLIPTQVRDTVVEDLVESMIVSGKLTISQTKW